MKNLIEDNDSYERRDTLILSGCAIPAGSTNENTSVIAGAAIRDKLNIEVSPADISTVHRYGKKPSTPKKCEI